MNKVTLRYTEPLLREAVRAFVFRALARRLGWLFLVAVTLLVVAIASLLVQQERSWVVGFLVASFLFAGIFVAALYVAQHRNVIERFRQMRTPEATFRYDEHELTFASDLGTATLPWSAIKEVWRYPRF